MAAEQEEPHLHDVSAINGDQEMRYYKPHLPLQQRDSPKNAGRRVVMSPQL